MQDVAVLPPTGINRSRYGIPDPVWFTGRLVEDLVMRVRHQAFTRTLPSRGLFHTALWSGQYRNRSVRTIDSRCGQSERTVPHRRLLPDPDSASVAFQFQGSPTDPAQSSTALSRRTGAGRIGFRIVDSEAGPGFGSRHCRRRNLGNDATSIHQLDPDCRAWRRHKMPAVGKAAARTGCVFPPWSATRRPPGSNAIRVWASADTASSGAGRVNPCSYRVSASNPRRSFSRSECREQVRPARITQGQSDRGS